MLVSINIEGCFIALLDIFVLGVPAPCLCHLMFLPLKNVEDPIGLLPIKY